jgi:glucose/arabinose dehydrogenase
VYCPAPARRGFRRLFPRALAAVALASALLPLPLVQSIPSVAASTLPMGFTDTAVVTGLNHPTNIAFAPGGRVFVSEKGGVVKTWASYASLLDGDAPATTIDIHTEVYDFWDRGLLGMTVDPGWPSRPYLYLLYTLDARPGDTPPHWNDVCPSPPGATSEGCVAVSRLARITVNTSTGVSTSKTNLLGGATSGADRFDWCQQFPSHSIGTVLFGHDGMLYVGSGDGASFASTGNDWGQLGGTLPSTANPVTPANPCADPVDPAHIPPAQNPATFYTGAQGGAMRAQGVRSSRTQITLDGSVLRLDPDTGAAASGNPLASSTDLNRRRVIAYGFRNPFRFTFRPGTNDLWLGDVGNSDWEELNRIPDITSARNYGWPCYENTTYGHYYGSNNPTLCSTISGVTMPYWAYNHTAHQASGDGCTIGNGSSISGLAFYTGANYPAHYLNGLFIADYTRNCIVFMPKGSNGLPDPTQVEPFEADAAGPVSLIAAPDGDIVYPVLCAAASGVSCPEGSGAIHRIHYGLTAAFTANPTSGTAPLHVNFDASSSSSPAGGLSFVWSFGDGTPDTSPSTSPTTSHTYATPGNFTARLTVTDANNATAHASRSIAAGNSPPSVTIDTPSSGLTWKVGDTINITGHATDAQDGTLSGSHLAWTVIIEHCPAVGCHEHLLTTFTGTSGTAVAPDHDMPTYLRILVTATDSGGLTDTAETDVQPLSSTVTIQSNPGGMPITFGGTSNAAGQTFTEIEGATRVVTASSPTFIGENEYAFSSWSDGGARSHNVTVPASNITLTANYTLIASDASNTCSGAPIRSPIGSWWSGGLATGTDVDWYRFTISSTQAVRVALGDLPVPAKLDLYRDCTTLLGSSNRGGTAPEEINKRLSAGTYALKVSALGTGDPNGTYKVRPKLQGTYVSLVSLNATTTASTLRLVGEVLNGSTSTRGPIGLTAKLYNSSGHLITTRSGTAYRTILPSMSKSPFAISGSLPNGFDHATISISSAPVTHSSLVAPTLGGIAGASVNGSWTTTGTVGNPHSKTIHSVRVFVTIYDDLGQVSGVAYVAPVLSDIAPHKSSTFKATFPAGLTPSYTYVTARARY